MWSTLYLYKMRFTGHDMEYVDLQPVPVSLMVNEIDIIEISVLAHVFSWYI